MSYKVGQSVSGVRDAVEAAVAMAQALGAPTRLCADASHSDYDPVWFPRVREVRLNGKPEDMVYAFDMREGWVQWFAHDAHGHLLRPPILVKREGAVAVDYEVPA